MDSPFRFSSRLYWGMVLLACMAVTGSTAVRAEIINDGSTTNELVRLANSEETAFGNITVLEVDSSGAFLVAEQIDLGWISPIPALRTTWYAQNAKATGSVYRVSAEFRPAALDAANQGGVMAWVDSGASNGLVFKVVPASAGPSLPASFQLAFVDFTATVAEDNENQLHLYSLDGSPATGSFDSAWSDYTNYLTTEFAQFELDFSLPSAEDLAVVTNATARVSAKVYQGADVGQEPAQVGRTIELLTDLPVPAPDRHRFGYFAVWSSFFAGDVIGYSRNLSADGQIQIQLNAPPTVSLVQPADGTTATAPATFTLLADANDPDGSVTEVEFYEGTNRLGRATAPPYTFTWSGVAEGSYLLTAVATDNEGESVVSEPVSVAVLPPSGTAPTLTVVLSGDWLDVSWTSPGFQLQYKTALGDPEWIDVPNTTGVTHIALPTSLGAQYFRLVGSGTPEAPTLAIVLLDDTLDISWTSPGFQLQYKTGLGDPEWIDVPNTTQVTHIELPTSLGAQYFRLVRSGTAEGPALAIGVAGNTITVSWPAGTTGYQLQAKDALGDVTWTDIATTGNTYTETLSGGITRFYRLTR